MASDLETHRSSTSTTASGQMRAGELRGKKKVRWIDVPLPEFGPNQVRVRLEGCGVCASNLPVWEGRPWFTYPQAPGAPGHEGWGIVDAVGENVTEFTPGDRVACLSYRAFAEYDLAEASACVRLPDALRDTPFPAEPLGCAINVFKRCDLQPGEPVAIVGIGFLGALLVQLAADAGARVIAFSRRQTALDIAKACGAEHAIPITDSRSTINELIKIEHGCPRVIETTGKQEGLDLASELTRVRGKLIIAGYHQDGYRQVDMQKWNWQGLDIINAHERDPQMYVIGMTQAVEAVLDGRMDPQPLLTHAFAGHELSHAMAAAHERPPGFLKAIVTY